ncbi:MAG TPA: hypothetical protein VMH50_14200 [Thermoleophilia bacterium]|nr:hypothetical protein [Thermoleophilia bacterium]
MVLHPWIAGLSASSHPRPLLFVARRFRLMAAILLVVWPMSACYRWGPLPAPEKGFGHADHVRVRTPEGRQLVVWYPQVVGDSLFGTSNAARKDTQDIRLGNPGALQMGQSGAGIAIVGGLMAGVLVLVWQLFLDVKHHIEQVKIP